MKFSYRYFPLFVLSFGCIQVTYAQDYRFAFGAGSTFSDDAYAITQDVNKNLYITGDFVGTVDFDPSASTANLVCPMAPCGYIAKYDSAGNYIWAKNLQANNGPMEGRALKIDYNGDLCLSGWFMDSVDFDPSGSIAKLGAQGAHDAFIAKYDTAGNYIWAKSFGGPAPDYIFGMDIDPANNIYVTGSFIAFADFDPSPAFATLNANSGSPDVFIAKYDANGNYKWAVNVGGPQQDEANAIRLDAASNLYITGYFDGAADFDPTGGLYLLASQGARDIFLTKYDSTGHMIWTTGIGGTGNDEGQALMAGDSGDVFLTGSFTGTVDFDPAIPATANRTSAGGDDIFLARYDTSGNYIWAKTMGGLANDIPNAIQKDSRGNLYLTGQFSSNNADFDPSVGVATISSAGAEDVFMARYDYSGVYDWAERVGGASPDKAYGLVIEDAKNIYLCGSFEGTADFDPSSSTATFTAGARDLFVAKYNFCTEDLVDIADTICDGELYDFGGTLLSVAGTYTSTMVNANGCDSTVTLDLTVNTVHVGVTQTNDSTLNANATGATYQWIECDLGILPGETGTSFTAKTNGRYAVIVTQNGCVDTSECVTVELSTGINRLSSVAGLQIFPNPSQGKFTVVLSEPSDINIYNITGELVHQQVITRGKQQVDLSHLNEGIYFLHTTRETQTIKINIVR